MGLLDRLSTNNNDTNLNLLKTNGMLFDTINNDFENEELPEEVEEICHYRVFNGSFNIELKDSSKKKTITRG